MNHKLFLIFFMVICNANLLAQHGRLVQGRITDTINNALPGVTIKLHVKEGKKNTLNTLSAADGSFTFSGVTSTEFTLVFTSIGTISKEPEIIVQNRQGPATAKSTSDTTVKELKGQTYNRRYYVKQLAA